MKDEKNVRKHSICLGISSILSIAYIAYQLVHIATSYEAASAQSAGAQLGTQIGITLSLPHLFFVALATIFLLVAFFTNGFGFAITAGVLFSVGGVLLFTWLPFVIPSIVLTFVGSAFCHKKKSEKREAEEERQYRKEHPDTATQRERNPRLRQQQEVMYEQPEPQRRMQPQTVNTNAYQSNPYMQNMQMAQVPMMNAQNPYMANPVTADPYAPITPVPQQMGMMPQQPFSNPAMQMQQGVGTYPVYGEGMGMQPPIDPAPVSPTLPQQNNFDTISTGYFDDFGNFHPGGNGNV